MKFVFTLVLGTLLIQQSFGWWWGGSSSNSCKDSSRGDPFYFGTTNLWCMKSKGKRSEHRSTLALSHRWILYKGYYFERLGKELGDIFSSAPRDGAKCNAKRERSPAGYSRLSVECIKKCTNSYRREYGKYSLLWNNCHYFANKLSDVLCTASTCPSWC